MTIAQRKHLRTDLETLVIPIEPLFFCLSLVWCWDVKISVKWNTKLLIRLSGSSGWCVHLLISWIKIRFLPKKFIIGPRKETICVWGCKKQRHRPACTSAQSDQCLNYSVIGNYHIKTCYKRFFSSLSLSRLVWVWPGQKTHKTGFLTSWHMVTLWYPSVFRCLNWQLPSTCTLDPPAAGKCCKTPNCPSNVVLNYPPGYTAE